MIDCVTEALFQVKTNAVKNAIGEKISTWQTVATKKGCFDLSGGSSSYTTYDAKIQESTHMFILPYFNYKALGIKSGNSRLVVESENYDIMLIDDPNNVHKQLEIYLKFTGG